MDYRAELDRRIGRFHEYLAPMDRRAHEEAQGPCYAVFENRHPNGDFGGQAAEDTAFVFLGRGACPWIRSCMSPRCRSTAHVTGSAERP